MRNTVQRDIGLIASDRLLASVKESLGVPGTQAAERLLTARLFDSLEFEVIPSRGFDIGDTWFRGVPVSWFSPVRDARALSSPSGAAWLSRFTGGLLTTCGFKNIGTSSSGEGLHGNASHLPADEVSWSVTDAGIELRAVVESIALFGPSFSVRRTITATTDERGTARLRVTDDITNVGPEAAPLSLMYHLNLGAPLVAPGSIVDIDSASAQAAGPHPEVPDWRVLPEPAAHVAEAVFEHHGVTSSSAGFARATVASSIRDLGVSIEWSSATLPRLHQWVFPTRGRWALGIEPATAPLFGPDREAEHAGAPLLEPGQLRSHEVRIAIGQRAIATEETA